MVALAPSAGSDAAGTTRIAYSAMRARAGNGFPGAYNYGFRNAACWGRVLPASPDIARFPSLPMTTLVVVRKGDEIAIAADSLTTFGDTRLAARHDRTYDKIVNVRDTYIGLCGSAAHQLVFESLLRRHEDLDFSDKFSIFETFRKLHPILKEQHFLNPKEEEDDPYESTQMTALIANPNGIFGVYSMREVFEYTQFWAAGSGHEFALGAMHALYSRLRTAESIAKAGLEAGAMFDRNSALPLTMYTLKVKGA
jgi:ATP-dependent HslUV protease subunit HslV